ncbi:MAG: helix-turn-helix domain-containing protein [Acidimicrobiia bacterium]
MNDALGYDLTFGLPPIRVGWWLRDVRTRFGHRESDVAEQVGVPARTLRRWESGSLVPSDLELSRLAGVYGCGVTDLVPGRERVTLERSAADASSGVLRIGSRETSVDLDSNDVILRRYLALVRGIRNLGPDAPVHLRHDDVAALAEELDLDDAELESRLVALAGITADEARWVRRQLMRRRVVTPLLGLGTATASILGIGAVVARAGHGADASTSTHVASVVAPASSSAFASEAPTDSTIAAQPGDLVVAIPQVYAPAPATPDATGSPTSVQTPPATTAPKAPARPSAHITTSAISIDNDGSDTGPQVGTEISIGDAITVTAAPVTPETAPAPVIIVEFGESAGSVIEAS